MAIYGDTAIVGAYKGDIGSNINQGSAYIFERNRGGADKWGVVKKLTASDGATDNLFGSSAAIYGDTAIVGDFRAKKGSAYIFCRELSADDQRGSRDTRR